jgi:CRISPR system Cascade subunit CasB
MEKNENIYVSTLTWWSELDYLKKDRAEIKRCSSIYEIQLLSGFYNLRNRLNKLPQKNIPNNDHLALIAGVLVRVKTSLIATEKTTKRTQILSRLMKDNVSQNRFQTVVKTTDLNELYRQLILILPLIGNQAYISQLINDLQFWSDNVKRTWAEAYYLN